MTADPEQFRRAIAAIDAANAQSPRCGDASSSELIHGQRVTSWLERLEPGASEALRLAARAQHVRRWEIPRDSYPMDREGYHRWRTRLYAYHAEVAGRILRDAGYADEMVDRVQRLLHKEGIKSDPEMQILEDAICLVFLEYEFTEFVRRKRYDDDKVIRILRRTWAKMSERGHAAALELSQRLPAEAQRLVTAAVQR